VKRRIALAKHRGCRGALPDRLAVTGRAAPEQARGGRVKRVARLL
jgi:hypothetical protein